MFTATFADRITNYLATKMCSALPYVHLTPKMRPPRAQKRPVCHSMIYTLENLGGD